MAPSPSRHECVLDGAYAYSNRLQVPALVVELAAEPRLNWGVPKDRAIRTRCSDSVQEGSIARPFLLRSELVPVSSRNANAFGATRFPAQIDLPGIVSQDTVLARHPIPNAPTDIPSPRKPNRRASDRVRLRCLVLILPNRVRLGRCGCCNTAYGAASVRLAPVHPACGSRLRGCACPRSGAVGRLLGRRPRVLANRGSRAREHGGLAIPHRIRPSVRFPSRCPHGRVDQTGL